MSNSDPKTSHRPGPWPPAPESKPAPPSSWAKKTGFRPKFSGETNASDSGPVTALPPRPKAPDANADLEAGRLPAPPPPPPAANGVAHREKVPVPVPQAKEQPAKKRRDSDGVTKSTVPSTNGQATATALAPVEQPPRRTARPEEAADALPQSVDGDGFGPRHSHMKYELRDSPGLGKYDNNASIFLSIRLKILMHSLKFLTYSYILIFFFQMDTVVPIGVYGIQHYASILGSLILIPLVIVPAMGGSHVSDFILYF